MIGKYGMMRQTYLKENHPVEYQQLMREGKLNEHLEEVNEEARKQMEMQMNSLTKIYLAPDQRNQLAWVQHMNSLKYMAEEVVLQQVVYA